MTTTQFATLVRYKTRTTSTTFTDAEILLLMNLFKDEISSLIVQRNSEYFRIPTTIDLLDNTREYALDDAVLNTIHKVEIKFTSSDARQPSTYIKDYRGSETESEIVKYYSNAPGGFAHTIRRRKLFILSGTIVAVTAGIQYFWNKYPEDFSSLAGSTGMHVDPSATTFGFPRQFHELLARRVSMEYKSRQPRPIPFSALEKNYEVDLENQLAAISSTDSSGEIIGDLPPAEDLGNNGHDY